jgi:hypothetical protein
MTFPPRLIKIMIIFIIGRIKSYFFQFYITISFLDIQTSTSFCV